MFETCQIRDWGRIAFREAWERQLELVEKRAAARIGDTLVLCEHDPVYTFGRSMKGQLPNGLPFPVHVIERGGKATYHGPGQLVVYPVTKLAGPAVITFMREFEKWIMDLLAAFGLKAGQQPSETGVWIQNRKIASLGIAVKRWVTFHGAAINVNPDLECFRFIEPCGYSPGVMTSLARELGSPVTVSRVKQRILARKPLLLVEDSIAANS